MKDLRELTRSLPAALEAEAALLGKLLMAPSWLEDTRELLAPADFAELAHQVIYSQIVRMADRGLTADAASLRAWAAGEPVLADLDGAYYLNRLLGAGAHGHAPTLARLVHHCADCRRLIGLSERMASIAWSADPSTDIPGAVDSLEGELTEISVNAGAGSPRPFAEAARAALDVAEQAYRRGPGLGGLSCGFASIDDILGGLAPGDLYLLGGRPSMGKSALAAGMATRVAAACPVPAAHGDQRRAGVGFFSLEMSAASLALRALGAATGVSPSRLRRGSASDRDMHRLVPMAEQLGGLPMFVDDQSGLTVGELRRRARRLKRQHGLGLVIVDYLQLMAGDRQAETRVAEITAISAGLKALAKELEVPVLALSQLSRNLESRDNKRPMLADLRESGALEQDADAVLFVHREEHYLSRDEPTRGASEKAETFEARILEWRKRSIDVHGKAEIIVAKNRHGPTGVAILQFDAERVSFHEVGER